MNNFEKIANLCHNDRVQAEQTKKHDLNHKAKIEHSLYCIWCRINNKEPNEQYFKEYVESEQRDVSFWVKKRIFELYFNYEFKYDNDKWFFKKLDATL